MKRIALVGLMGLLWVFVPTANGQIVIQSPLGAQHPYAHWAKQSEVPLPSRTVQIQEFPDEAAIEETCFGEALACEFCPEDQLETCPYSIVALVMHTGQDRWNFFHELGHMYDEMGYLSDRGKRKFLRLSGSSPDRPWVTPHEEALWSSSPNERFAEDFALCATLPRVPRSGSWNIIQGVVGGPSFREICRMVGRDRLD